MNTRSVKGLRVAVLATDGFEQSELLGPFKALQSAGAVVELVSLRPGTVQGMNALRPAKKIAVDRLLAEAEPSLYDALLLSGGSMNPDQLRQSEAALAFVRAFDVAGKPIAVVGHGPWMLLNAGLVRGRRLTSWPGLRAGIMNAGGLWDDSALVRDKNWVSGRSPQDLKAFIPEMLALFAAHTPIRAHDDLSVSRRRRGLPVLLAGLVALAGLGYAVFQQRQPVYPAQPNTQLH